MIASLGCDSANSGARGAQGAPARHFPYRRRATENFRTLSETETISEMSDLSCQIRRRQLTNAFLDRSRSLIA